MSASIDVPSHDSIALPTWRDAGRRHLHRGLEVFYVIGGGWRMSERPVMLALHGFPTASYDWSRLWIELCHRYRVVAPDLLGFGFSAKPQQYAYSILDQANIVESLLGRLGVSEYHLIAHDYGDSVGQELLARHEERLSHDNSSLVLRSVLWLNGGLFPEAHRPLLIQHLLWSPLGPLVSRALSESRFVSSFARVFGSRTQPTSAELADFWSLIAHNDGTRIAHRLIRYLSERRHYRSRWVGAMHSTSVPQRFVVGTADPVSGTHMASRYRELIPAADVMLLSDIGHYPQWEAPPLVLRALQEFHASFAD